MIEIDEDLISYMVENTLTVGIYGKVEPKKRQLKSEGMMRSTQQSFGQ